MNRVITMGSVAYALSGLGGSNAHAAGFLAAAQELAKQPVPAVPRAHPTFISCTSGTVYWVAKYLEGKEDLRQLIRDESDAVRRASMMPGNELGRALQSLAYMSWIGRPGLLEPVIPTYVKYWVKRFRDFLTPGSPGWLAVPTNLDELWDLVLPAKLFTPTLDPMTFVDMANTLKSAGIGIAFNSYEPESGIEYVHVNPLGLEMMRDTLPEAEYGLRVDDRVYEPITPDAVRNALWLLEYGFDRSDNGRRLTDGEYVRSIIVDELAFADEIICVRPVNTRWIGHLPQNIPERVVLQMDLWLNASYREQRDNIDLVNKFVDGWRGHQLQEIKTDAKATGNGAATVGGRDGQLPERGLPKKYHRVTLTPVEVQSPRSFFDSFVESVEVFDQACSQSLKALRNSVPAVSESKRLVHSGEQW